MFLSWIEAGGIYDLEDDDLKEALREPKLANEIVVMILGRKEIEPLSVAEEEFAAFVRNLRQNLIIEIARRKLAYDRVKLKPFGQRRIKELIDCHGFPEVEFRRAHLMRIREETGREIDEAELGILHINL